MSIRFSIIHATYKRPAKAFDAMMRWHQMADRPEDIDYIFCINSDDDTTAELKRLVAGSDLVLRFVEGPFPGAVPAWDAGAAIANGEVFIQGQDDIEPPLHWDGILLEWLEGSNVDRNHWRRVPVVVAVQDGYRHDRLLCTAICNRLRYEQQGHFLYPKYLSVFSDDEFTYRAYRDERDGRCMVIQTDTVFRHRHHYHDKSVPFDQTYARENREDAYVVGGVLFHTRNPAATRDGIVTWR